MGQSNLAVGTQGSKEPDLTVLPSSGLWPGLPSGPHSARRWKARGPADAAHRDRPPGTGRGRRQQI